MFLLDRNEWLRLATVYTQEKYIFIYDQENNPLIRECAKKIAFEKNMKIYAIKSLYPMSYADKKISNAGPGDFLGLINNCEICLTNSFHCIAFSLIFQKDFLLFKRTHQKVNSRMIDLLDTVNLSHRIINNRADIASFFPEIQYSSVNEKLKEKIDFSKNYLILFYRWHMQRVKKKMSVVFESVTSTWRDGTGYDWAGRLFCDNQEH